MAVEPLVILSMAVRFVAAISLQCSAVLLRKGRSGGGSAREAAVSGRRSARAGESATEGGRNTRNPRVFLLLPQSNLAGRTQAGRNSRCGAG